MFLPKSRLVLCNSLACIVLTLLFWPAMVLGQGQMYDEEIAPFFQAHCLRCHSEKKSEGDLQLA